MSGLDSGGLDVREGVAHECWATFRHYPENVIMESAWEVFRESFGDKYMIENETEFFEVAKKVAARACERLYFEKRAV